VILAFWRPAGLWSIAVAFILAAASYAALGLLVGVLVRGDLEGFFLIIMTALLDTFLENPVDNPLANKPILEFFPSYGPTQFAAAGAFHHQVLPGMVVVSLAWTAAFALLGLAVLWLRMPHYSLRRTRPGWLRAAASPGSAAITTAAASQPADITDSPADGTATTAVMPS
jgi:ABC-2 type transport system permease protein